MQTHATPATQGCLAPQWHYLGQPGRFCQTAVHDMIDSRTWHATTYCTTTAWATPWPQAGLDQCFAAHCTAGSWHR